MEKTRNENKTSTTIEKWGPLLLFLWMIPPDNLLLIGISYHIPTKLQSQNKLNHLYLQIHIRITSMREKGGQYPENSDRDSANWVWIVEDRNKAFEDWYIIICRCIYSSVVYFFECVRNVGRSAWKQKNRTGSEEFVFFLFFSQCIFVLFV